MMMANTHAVHKRQEPCAVYVTEQMVGPQAWGIRPTTTHLPRTSKDKKRCPLRKRNTQMVHPNPTSHKKPRAHGRYIRGIRSKVRRGSIRSAGAPIARRWILLEVHAPRSTGKRSPKVLRSAGGQCPKTISALTPPSLINQHGENRPTWETSL